MVIDTDWFTKVRDISAHFVLINSIDIQDLTTCRGMFECTMSIKTETTHSCETFWHKDQKVATVGEGADWERKITKSMRRSSQKYQIIPKDYQFAAFQASGRSGGGIF